MLPLCISVFQDAIKTKEAEEKLQLMDISELLVS
jgi:hypothetical protein